jgi:hypothetical protein
MVLLLSIVALVAVVTVTVVADREPVGEIASTGTVPEPTVGTQQFLDRLAEQGYVPPEAIDRERLLLERLVERGDIPAATLEPRSGNTAPD